MRLVIEAADFRRLSPETQRELLRHFSGRELVEARNPTARAADGMRAGEVSRQPIDLTHELTIQLMHGLAENHRRRMRCFAGETGRVSMKQLLKATGDTDARVLSYFQSVVTRKMRRVTGDTEKRTYLIGWDFDSTRWNRDHTRIVDGVYYVTPTSARMLAAWFDNH